MKRTLEKLEDIEKNGFQIDFGNVFNHAFENYKKIALYAGLVLFIFIVLFIVVATVSLVSILGIAQMTEELTPEKLQNLSEENLLIIGAIMTIVSSLLSPFQASFLKMAHHGDRDENFPVSSLFSYYKYPYSKEIILATFLILTASYIQSNLFVHFKFEFTGSIISYFISFITILTIPLIVFGKLGAIDAIKHSIKIVFKQPFVLLALMIVAVIGSFVGFIGCCIGIFFTMPFLYSMNYAIYSAIVGIDDSEENAKTQHNDLNY
ncbi:hypothetical protein [Flavobacterium sp.]|uniref:hypothetical protein n=1 Tax=Flavobacterium sp. TaxID=239 RepID=UPI002CB08892|nr:hypothetical protein [Flavobacterium sp.]HSD06793.1 hypothetical protein [Flavobacterium sp.]